MTVRLKDIIDLDYLINMDDALESEAEINSRLIKDRSIYGCCKDGCQTDSALLVSWLNFRKEEFLQDKGKKGLHLLPGTIFSSLYAGLMYVMIFSGSLSGVSLAYSFLAYHGTRPINVAVFFSLFVVLQVVLIFITLALLLQRGIRRTSGKEGQPTSIVHSLLSSFFFNVLPNLLKKADLGIFKKSLDTLEYTSSLIRMKNREYKALFFWPFFILTSVFAFCFSAGALGGTFFRVIVSDMAFGWQSTIMTTSIRIHGLVSFIALPWSWFMPQSLAHPSLAQIEGSRMVLKDGISVLFTQDLVSWWPFLCMGILVYAVIPRGLLMIAGILAQHRVLAMFNFERPVFQQLIVRMQSPVLDIDADEIPGHTAPLGLSVEPGPAYRRKEGLEVRPDSARPVCTAVLLASETVYTEAAVNKVILYIKNNLFFDVKKRIGVSFDFEADTEAVQEISKSRAEPVILVHEVWQPPIRGLLYYIKQIKAAMPENTSLWIVLTQDAGQEDLSVEENSTDFKVWKEAVFHLQDPDIKVKRFYK